MCIRDRIYFYYIYRRSQMPRRKTLEERAREALGDAATYADADGKDALYPYFAAVMAKSDEELLGWIYNECDNAKGVITEGYHYFEPEYDSKLELGTRILRSNLVRMLFVLNEFR